MTTQLPRGKKLARTVPSRISDARRTESLVIELDHTTPLPMIRLRPKGKRSGVEVSVDGLYFILTKRGL
jgi:hypothetical protein